LKGGEVIYFLVDPNLDNLLLALRGFDLRDGFRISAREHRLADHTVCDIALNDRRYRDDPAAVDNGGIDLRGLLRATGDQDDREDCHQK